MGTNDFRISNQGNEGQNNKDARFPAIAYNDTDNQYLVVWTGDDNAPLANDEFEIYGQLLDATGAEVGGDFRISEMGPDGSADYSAQTPTVAYRGRRGGS